MGGIKRKCLVFLFFLFSIMVVKSFATNVTYDSRALVIDGKRRVMVSGSIHYPRSTPEMWPDLIQKSKDGGLDVIETYVFWNSHEPVKNKYDFEGRLDLVKFVKLVAEAGLYVHLRIGPYVCAEWNYGGFPVWLHFIPGIKFRTDNEPFKAEMRRFTSKIVDMMKQEKLYASQGGPIILSQIENEYGNIQSSYGSAAKSYVNWAAKMATSLNTGVPWVMCQQADAPDPIINTCNGFYCDQFTPNSKNKPKMWTENWSGWFLSFGGRAPYRPVEDLGFSVARFYQRGGTFQNYYMYHGGTNFGRTSGGPFIATSYDYDAPIDEYGLIRQPKWGHLKDLHKAIKLCEEALVASDPVSTSLGPNLEGTVYKRASGSCAAFLANIGSSDTTVKFNGDTYHLPAWSVSILPDCQNVVFNTAKINSMAIIPTFDHRSLRGNAILDEVSDSGSKLKDPATILDDDIASKKVELLENTSTTDDRPLEEYANPSEAIDSGWSWINEPVGISKDDAFTKDGLLEQISTTTFDRSDYLWYSLSTDIAGDEPFLEDGSQTVLHVESLGHALHAFINGKLAGSGTGNSDNAKVSVQIPITMTRGKNRIDLLSMTVGLQNYGAFFDTKGAGITGPVSLKGSKNGINFDLTSQQWTYQVGLKGDDLGLPGGKSSKWVSQGPLPKKQALTWYKAKFNVPGGNDPVALDFTGMGKGEAWINGQSIGRYWPSYIASSSGCTSYCNYRGPYKAEKCLKNCGKPSQERYHVPRSWLEPSENTLVLFEEIGGDPTLISLATRKMGSLCAHISESHPSPVDTWNPDSKANKKLGPTLHLECPYPNQTISSIKFASFGTPKGTCGSYSHGKCSSDGALSTVQEACVGSKVCTIEVSVNMFGDPCKRVAKSLAVEATCS